jgi:hypothetical protein
MSSASYARKLGFAQLVRLGPSCAMRNLFQAAAQTGRSPKQARHYVKIFDR